MDLNSPMSKPPSARKVKFSDEVAAAAVNAATGLRADTKSESKVKFVDSDEGLEGIARKVVNIDGNPRLPRRGQPIYSKQNTTLNDRKDVQQKDHGTGDLGAGSKLKVDAKETITYANMVQAGKCTKTINFRFLESMEKQENVDVVLPRESVKVIHDKLAFTLYGYFLGDIVAYPVVEYFVRTNLKKYGLQKSMMNANGFFFFKFGDKKGMLDVLEGGPWLIRNRPIFLNTWSPTSILKKEDIKKAAIWVKLHDVPLAAYTDDGLSLLASKVGSPRLLDTYTSSMCSDTWGRSSYARALIEISAEHDFKDVVSIAIPDLEGEGYATEKVEVEYEWKPPRCSLCCVFGHMNETCPKNVCPKQAGTNPTQNSNPKSPVDNFTEVKSRKEAKGKGMQVKAPSPKFQYKPVDYKRMVGASSATKKAKVSSTPKIQTHNKFDVLTGNVNSEDLEDETVEVIYDETTKGSGGASTSHIVVSNG